MMVIIHQFLGPPLVAVVSMACHAGLEESQEASIPLVDVSRNVDVSIHVGGVMGDEVGAKDTA